MPYNKVWDFFGEIYCINLDHRTDRWEHAQKEFDKVGALEKVKRFPAIPHKDGRIGIIKSNLEIVKLAESQNLENVLVFEDDVKFINDTQILEKAIEQIKKFKWALFYLGANTHEQLQTISPSHPNLLILQNAFAVHAMSYNKIIYNHFIKRYENINHIQELAYQDILDVYLAQVIQKKNLCLITNPMIATQMESYSDIEKKEVNYSFIEDRFNNNTKHIK